MPGKLIPCALCQVEAAVVFCVNDDANLCTSCDASVHSGNPLLARHERRPLSVLTQQGESAAGAPAASATTDADVAVVPQLSPREAEGEADTPLPPLPALPGEPAVAAAPLTLYEDSFFARSLSASDLLDLDSDDLLLPASPTVPSVHAPHNNAFSNSNAFSLTPNHHHTHHHHDPLADGVVPSFGESTVPRYSFGLTAPAPTLQQQKPSPFLAQQHPFAPSYMRPQQPAPSPLMHYGMRPAYAAPKQRTPEEEAEEAARLARHRERQRKKRNFGRTVRYQSRRAYAEIRPRIKGRFVTPEEYAVYQAQQAAGKAGVPYVPGSASPALAPSPAEDDAVVPMPTFVA